MSLQSAGIDALSFSMQSNSDWSKFVHDLYDKYIQADKDAGNDVKVVTRHTYEGVASKHYFAGSNGRREFYETSGGTSDEIANQLRVAGVKLQATRTDWSVTFSNPNPPATYANKLRRQVHRRVRQSGQAVPGTTRLFESKNNGNTLYIQTGDKSIMHRTYNKAVESPGMYEPDTWRHELQMRGIRAKRAYQQFQISPGSDYLSRGFIIGFLLQYGIHEPWMEHSEPVGYPSKASKSDTQSRLDWLEQTALPVVEKLLAGNVTHAYLVELFQRAGLNCIEFPKTS